MKLNPEQLGLKPLSEWHQQALLTNKEALLRQYKLLDKDINETDEKTVEAIAYLWMLPKTQFAFLVEGPSMSHLQQKYAQEVDKE